MPGLRCTEMSLIAVQTFWGRPTSIVGQLQDLEVAREGAVEVAAQAVGVERGEEADLAVVDREHRHARARVLAQRGEDRPVAAQHDAEVGPAARRRADLDALGGLERELARLLLVEHAAWRPRAARRPISSRSASLVPSIRRWVMTATVMPRPPRARRRRRSSAPARPPSASHANVSRLPFGPGSPDGAKPSTAAPSERAQSATAATAARRASGSRTTPPRLTPARPTSNCGLTIASASKRGAAHASTAGSTLRREMKETSITIRSGA